MSEIAPYRPHVLLVDDDGTVIGERRAQLVPGEPVHLSVIEEMRGKKKREQKNKSYQTQIEKLKRDGLYGSSSDPMWNPRTRMHDCCGAPRAYYHRKGCKVAGNRLV